MLGLHALHRYSSISCAHDLCELLESRLSMLAEETCDIRAQLIYFGSCLAWGPCSALPLSPRNISKAGVGVLHLHTCMPLSWVCYYCSGLIVIDCLSSIRSTHGTVHILFVREATAANTLNQVEANHSGMTTHSRAAWCITFRRHRPFGRRCVLAPPDR